MGLLIIEQDLVLAETIRGIAIIPYLFAVVVWLILIFKMWTFLPKDYARTTPIKAVGFLFIPFYNIYWIFQAVWGFSKDFNQYITSKALNVPLLQTNLFLVFTIIWLLTGLLSWGLYEVAFFLDIAIAIILPIMVSNICDGLNAISDYL